jgi:hypothetical protein
MSSETVYVCRVSTSQGQRDYVTLLPSDVVFEQGLSPETIVGELAHPLGPGESIQPENFARNRVFVAFLHEVIARHAPEQPGFQAEARRLGNGWLYLIDQRTPTPQGPVPPEDILGAFQIQNGEVVPGSYQASSRHRILSSAGFFRLEPGLHQCLLQELAARNSGRRA